MAQIVNLNDSSPAAPSGALNVKWQKGPSSGTDPATGVPIYPASANVAVMGGDSGSGGTMGLVPAPAAGDAAAGKVLKADGTWYVPPGSNPMTDVGDLIIGGAVSGGVATPTRLAAGAAGKVLTSNGASTAPSWQTSGAGSYPVDAPPSSTTFPPALASMTQVNIAQATLLGAGGAGPITIWMSGANGVNINAIVAALPGSPYSITLNAKALATGGAGILRAMLLVRNSSSGAIVSIDANLLSGGAVSAIKWNSATSYNSTYSLNGATGQSPQDLNAICLRISDDGTNRTFYVSPDKGYTFIEVLTTANTDFLTADQYGVAMDTEGSGQGGFMVVSGLTVG